MTTLTTINEQPDTGNDDAQRQAQALSPELFDQPDDAARTTGVVASFLTSWHADGAAMAPVQWLDREFARYPTLWRDEAERRACAGEVVEAVHGADLARGELDAHLARGKSRESWLAAKLEQGAALGGMHDVGVYAGRIDAAIDQASGDMAGTIYRRTPGMNGELLVNRNPSLNGFIAEQHHVDTFNIDAAANNSPLRAKVLAPEPGAPYQKNSMDIGIYDANGKLVRRYQAKYCRDAEATQQAFEAGDYRGQRKLVCKEQVGDVPGATDRIEMDGVKSTPLSKDEARRIQERAQIEQEVRAYDWNDVNRIRVTKELGRKALAAAVVTVGLHGVHMLARRAWNAVKGKDNPPFGADLKNFFANAAGGGAQAGLQVAVAGALVVAARSGWIKVLRNTPAGQIANIAYVGLENAKVLYRLARGELSPAEALDAMGNVTASAIGGIAGGTQGMAAGAAIGSLLGPAGTLVGGFVGGMVGCMAGSTVAGALYEGAKSLVSSAKTFVSAVAGSFASVGRALGRLFS